MIITVNIIMTAIIFAAAFALMSRNIGEEGIFKSRNLTDKKNEKYNIILLVLIAAIVRVICAVNCPGHTYDMGCFREWSSRLAADGFSAFYSSGNFNNYPPGYMYLLWLIGKINNYFVFDEITYNFVLKIPSMILDLVSGIFIYKVAKKKLPSGAALMIMSLWLFNPAAVVDSALWGQVDIFYSFLITVMLYFIAERKLIYSYFAFAASIMLKPQTFIMTPILIFGIIEQVFLEGFDKKVFFKNLFFGCAAIGAMFLISAPFGINSAFKQYTITLQGSGCFSLSAFNLWSMIGKNELSVTPAGKITGYLFIAASVALSAVIYFRTKGKAKVYLSGGMLMLSTFMLSVSMNERYAYLVMLLFLMAYIELPAKENFVMYSLVTIMQFVNFAWALFFRDLLEHDLNKLIIPYATGSMIMYVYILYIALTRYCMKRQGKPSANNPNNYYNEENSLTPMPVPESAPAEKPAENDDEPSDF